MNVGDPIGGRHKVSEELGENRRGAGVVPLSGNQKVEDPIGGRYKFVEQLGKNKAGMGIVLLCEDQTLGRKVVVKLVRGEFKNDPVYVARLKREAFVGAQLKSPNAVQIYDSNGLENGDPYLVMEYLEGHDLFEEISSGPIDLDRALAWVLDACDVVAEVHRLGMVHRDLKPANLFLQNLESRERVKVLDFGIARLPDELAGYNLTRENTAPGTPPYMSPEQARGEQVGPPTDIWALGAILYELAVGERAWPASEKGIFDSIRTDPTPRILVKRPGLPDELDRIVGKCLEKDASRRYASVPLLERDLRALRFRLPGNLIDDRYRVVEIVAEGGMGTVLRCHDTKRGRDVAVKVLKSDCADRPDYVAQFERQARAAKQLTSAHAERIRAWKAQKEEPYLVVDHLRGQNLRTLLKESGPPQLTRAVGWVLDACEVVGEAHALGIFHRDLKLSSLFLQDTSGKARPQKTSSGGRIKVLGLGIARSADEATGYGPTQAESPRETLGPKSSAPAAADDSGVAADISALGTILGELTGAGRVSSSEGRLLGERSSIQARLRRIVRKCLERNASQRYSSVRALERNLRDLQSELKGKGWSGLRRLWWAALGVCAGAALAAAATWHLLSTPDREPTRATEREQEKRSPTPMLQKQPEEARDVAEPVHTNGGPPGRSGPAAPASTRSRSRGSPPKLQTLPKDGSSTPTLPKLQTLPKDGSSTPTLPKLQTLPKDPAGVSDQTPGERGP